MSDTRQLNHHLLGILLRHLEIRDRVKQVDMSNLLTTTYKAIQRLHQLTWIEAIALTKVDKQSAITLLSFVLQLLLVALWLSLLPVGHYCLNLRSLSIVSQELTKLKRYNLLYQLLLVDILKVAIDVLHKWSYLLVVNIRLYNLVHHLVELLLADFLSRRNLCLHKLLTDYLLDIANLELLATMYDRD